MIITCPNCHTRYRVASDALSAAGRQVQCAACAQLWYAAPSFPQPRPPRPDPEPDDDELAFRADDDALFTPDDEALLDRAFLAAEPGEQDEPAPSAPAARPHEPVDPATSRARDKALHKRRKGMMASLPVARLRRAARVAVSLVLLGSLAAAIGFRTEIVRAFPQLDGLYRLVGLGTNVVGLDFTDVKTLRTTRDGMSLLIVTAKISNTTNRVAFVPSVLISLIGTGGQVVYEWMVNPTARNILPGDVLVIDAQLTGPPDGVATVRLSFAES